MIILFMVDYALFSQAPLRLIPFAAGLSSPTSIVSDHSYRFLVTQRAGTIVIVDSAGILNPMPFLDITSRVNSAFQEQGLLGIALHPEFSINGYFYINYTGTGDSTHISRFMADPGNPSSALPSSEFKLLTIFQPFPNHNGGDLQFGPDGYLYIGMGDGGSAGDPGNRAQNKAELLGKILRIDVNVGNPYGIPANNPFITDPLARHEIWALGVRNPWRFSFDKQSGDLWIGDVGQDTLEEIDLQPATSIGGENYGWRCFEGSLPYNTTGCQPQSAYVSPVYEYFHEAPNCWSVTGGYISRGNKYPGLAGRYFFADYCNDIIWSLRDSSGVKIVRTEGVYPGNNFSTFGEDSSGTLYIAGLSSGRIFKIADSTVSGITSHDDPAVFNIYPNPFAQKIRIHLRNGSGNTMIQISDMAGRTCFSLKVSQNDQEISLQELPTGTYILHAENDAFSLFRKIIKR